MQQYLTSLFQMAMKARSWVFLVLSAIAIKWISLYPPFVEKYYTYGVYPVISTVQRFLLGWIPISMGDLLYAFLILVVLFRVGKLIRVIYQKKFDKDYLLSALKQAIFLFLLIYVFFYGLWGLNYSRLGISHQLGLEIKKYEVAELDSLTKTLVGRVNQYAVQVSDEELSGFRKKRKLFQESREAFRELEKTYPFLRYEPKSIKPSLYSYLGNYLGFQGYYNPFSGEGQVNTTIPPFLEPFVACHEIGHQLGYAREYEANFIAFLACRNYDNPVFRYSLYFDMLHYTIDDLYRQDSVAAKKYIDQLDPLVKKHRKDLVNFYKGYRNPIEPVISNLYGQYLKANGQPEGKRSYNRIVAWLVAYGKKFGEEAL